MTPPWPSAAAYDKLAAHYDQLTAHHDYDGWTRNLEQLAREHGMRGRRLLDVGCGTGKSFLPMLERGYAVVACDVAPGMLAEAHRKAPEVRLHACDVQDLPKLGSFDLVWSLDDCLNHLLSREALHAGLRGIAANLAPDGLAVFDVNTLATYRSFFAATSVSESEDTLIVWEGLSSATAGAGTIARARLTALERTGSETWRDVRVELVQRHHPAHVVLHALARAGLECVALCGQGLDGIPGPGLDELHHSKAVYVARHAR